MAKRPPHPSPHCKPKVRVSVRLDPCVPEWLKWGMGSSWGGVYGNAQKGKTQEASGPWVSVSFATSGKRKAYVVFFRRLANMKMPATPAANTP
jgi:hypothetical protein